MPSSTRTTDIEALAASRAARRRWNQMALGGRAMRLLSAIDLHLGGYGKTSDQITVEQLMQATGFKYHRALEEARADVVARGCVAYAPSRGGRSAGGVGHGSTYAYCADDIEAGRAEIAASNLTGSP